MFVIKRFKLILIFCLLPNIFSYFQKQPPEVFCKKKVFLEISPNSQENTCARVSFLIKLQAPPATLLKKRLWHRCFAVSFAKFLRTLFSQNTSGQLLLYFPASSYAFSLCLHFKEFQPMLIKVILIKKSVFSF